MRTVALLAAYNERRFIEPCLEHLEAHGIDAYLIDNESTDETVPLAERWLGRNLVGIESLPRKDRSVYDWRAVLRRKEELATELDADWFIHQDPDELRLPPTPSQTLNQALKDVDRAGFNAVNFTELTFIPTVEQPDHDHREFQRTLRTYYPFSPQPIHRLNAWKATPDVELAASAGHQVRIPDLHMYPQPFPMKHYLFLSVPHAIEKYVERQYDPDEVSSGWHGWRAAVGEADIRLPSESELRLARSDLDIDLSAPWKKHYLDAQLSPTRERF